MRIQLIALLLLIPNAVHAQNPPERWELIETIRIGDIDGPNSLTEVDFLLLGQDNQKIYVGQRQEHTIRVFDSTTGEMLQTIGRAGNGPGEFQGLGRIGWKQDTLYAVDIRLQRISFFTPEGEHLSTERTLSPPLIATRKPATPRALSSGGVVIGESMISMGPAASGSITSAPVVLMTREGEVLGKIAERDLRDKFYMGEIGSGVVMLKQPMTSDLFWDISPSGSLLVLVQGPSSIKTSTTFRVTGIRLDEGIDTTYRRSFRYTPRPVRPEEADSIIRSYASGDEPSAAEIEAIKEVVRIPYLHPPISDVALGSGGEVWLRREQTTGNFVAWFVLDDRGRVKATLRVPTGLKILAISGDAVWGMVRDELDVPYVVGYEVRPESNQ